MTGQSDTTLQTGASVQTTPVLQPDLAEQKARAEIRKLQGEIEKLDKDIGAIPAADLVRQKIEAEIDKTRLDAAKLARENRHAWIEPIKALSGLSSICLAFVAVGTLWVSFQTTKQAAVKAEQDAHRLERDAVQSLIRDLAAEQRGLRATSARRLSTYVTHSSFGPSVISSLVSAVVLEPTSEVQDAILQTLEPALQSAQPQLTLARSQLDGEIARLFSNVGPSTRELSKDDERSIQSKQQAMIKITLTLPKTAQCSPPPCGPNFKKVMSLRHAKFFTYRDRLKGAIFGDAVLTEADFFGVDASGADFTGAHLEATEFAKANLVGARFDRANLRIIKRGTGMLERAQFKGADLAGATFVDACLGGADFTETNVDPAALAQGFTNGIQLEPEKLAKLGTPRSDKRCDPVQE